MASPRPPETSEKAAILRLNSGVVTIRGTVKAGATLPLVVPAHGWVKQAYFSDGDYVQAGQILLKLFYDDMPSEALSRGYLTAPRSGFLVKKSVDAGTHVRRGTYVASLVDVSSVKVSMVVSSRLAQAVQVGDQVPVRITELPERIFMGIVSNVVTQAPRYPTWLLTITVKNAAPLIKPMMHASVMLKTTPAAASMAKR